MRKGTTPSFTFTLPFGVEIIAKAKVVIGQGGKILFEKRDNDLLLDGNTITLKLTQEETFKMDCKKQLEIYLRVLTLGGDALKTDTYVINVCDCMDNEVL